MRHLGCIAQNAETWQMSSNDSGVCCYPNCWSYKKLFFMNSVWQQQELGKEIHSRDEDACRYFGYFVMS